MKRIIILILMMFIVPLVSAQDETPQVEAIPILSGMPLIKLSSDGQTLAFHDFSVLQGDEIVVELVPIKLVNIATGELDGVLFRGSDYTQAMAISPDGTLLATTEFDGDLFIWSLPDGDLIKEINALPGQTRMTFLDNNHLATVGSSYQPVIAIWDIELEHIVQLITPDINTYQEFREQDPMVTQSQTISTMIYIPEINSLITATYNDDMYAIDLETGERRQLRDSGEDLPMLSIRQMMASADGSMLYYLVNGRDESNVYQIDLATDEETALIESTEETRVFAVAVHTETDRMMWIEQTDRVPSLWMDSLSNPGNPTEIPVPDDLPEDLRLVGTDIRIFFTPDGNTAIIGGFATTSDDHKNALIKVMFD